MKRFCSEYGMLFVLLLLGAFFSWCTLAEQQPTGAAAVCASGERP